MTLQIVNSVLRPPPATLSEYISRRTVTLKPRAGVSDAASAREEEL